MSLRLSAGNFHNDKNDRTDKEVHEQTPIFRKERMPHRERQVRHEQKVDGVTSKDGDERFQEIFHHRIATQFTLLDEATGNIP